jgi:hypothetical protein
MCCVPQGEAGRPTLEPFQQILAHPFRTRTKDCPSAFSKDSQKSVICGFAPKSLPSNDNIRSDEYRFFGASVFIYHYSDVLCLVRYREAIRGSRAAVQLARRAHASIRHAGARMWRSGTLSSGPISFGRSRDTSLCHAIRSASTARS